MEADNKTRIGAHFVSVRQTVQSAMAQVRKVREEQTRAKRPPTPSNRAPITPSS